jgi:hypothetical protein
LSKWVDPNTPKSGWRCEGVEDTGEPGPICEMCEEQIIRYVHTMVHGDRTLECGCICAGHMEGNPKAAKDRETAARNRTKRRFNFPGLAGWRTSQKGNRWITRGGWRVVIVPRGSQFVASITKGEERAIWSRRSYPTELAAFDRIEHLKAKEAEW